MRTKSVVPRLRAKKRLFKRVKGSVGGRRDFRRLWIVRLNAAARERGLRYSQLIAGLEKIGCELDRRTLAEMAVLDPTGFDAVAAAVRQALGVPEPAAVA